MNINQPASSFLKQDVLLADPVYSVVSQTENEVVVLNSKARPLSKGQLLIFENDVRGHVLSTSGSEASILINSVRPVFKGKLVSSFKAKIEQPLRISNQFGVGGLSVSCDYVPEHVQGYLGWSLYGPSGSLLALGNDFQKRLECSLPSSGLWLPGSYRIQVRAFSSNNLAPLANAAAYWTIQEPISILKKGTYDDNSRALTLR
jgi:hypothetical protein